MGNSTFILVFSSRDMYHTMSSISFILSIVAVSSVMFLACVMFRTPINGSFEQWVMSKYNKINTTSNEEHETLTQTHVISDDDADSGHSDL